MAPGFGMSPPQGIPAQMQQQQPLLPSGNPMGPGVATLAAFYAGQKYIVNKDRFICSSSRRAPAWKGGR